MGDVVDEGTTEAWSVLLVDDDERVLTMLQRALAAPACRICVAHDGVSALADLATQRFDLLISDIQMPGMNGLKLLHAVREHDLDLPVVLVTGYPDLKTAAAALEYGAFQYLIKPVEIERLRAVVERAVNVGRMERLKRQCVEELSSSSFYVGDQAGIEATHESALRSLWLAYQPIVAAADGKTLGYEALLRSEEPLLRHPSAILKAAEKVRRIHDVGRRVRDIVAVDAHRFADPSALLFMNLHAEDLLDPSLYMAGAGLSRIASRVVLELTDRASLELAPDVLERVQRLRALGFRIAIDDVGAEQAAASAFQWLDPEFVKLDVSLVRGVETGPAKRKLVHSMITVCHNLGKLVIAEGVENSSQHEALLEAGCDFLQGYCFGRPAPLDAASLKGAAAGTP
jgi:EAL domain-containing protein (putative c-di-GMP-specific phosphodiesterase class I)/ActR/RegA family two-component response regulator